MNHIRNGFGCVRPYLHGPSDLPGFVQQAFDAVEVERSDEGPVLLQGETHEFKQQANR